MFLGFNCVSFNELESPWNWFNKQLQLNKKNLIEVNKTKKRLQQKKQIYTQNSF